jgi:hypothetical protein
MRDHERCSDWSHKTQNLLGRLEDRWSQSLTAWEIYKSSTPDLYEAPFSRCIRTVDSIMVEIKYHISGLQALKKNVEEVRKEVGSQMLNCPLRKMKAISS